MTPSSEVPQTVLLVEDNADIRCFVQHTLEEGGLEVLVAADAVAAVQIEGQFPRAIHLLLSDVMMPELDGPSLAEQLRAVRPDVRVIFMSAYCDELLVLLDGSPLVQKPFSPRALLKAVGDSLAQPPKPLRRSL